MNTPSGITLPAVRSQPPAPTPQGSRTRLPHAVAMEMVTLSQAAILQPRAPRHHAAPQACGLLGMLAGGPAPTGGDGAAALGHSTGRCRVHGRGWATPSPADESPRHKPLIWRNAGKIEAGPKPADQPRLLEQVSSPWGGPPVGSGGGIREVSPCLGCSWGLPRWLSRSGNPRASMAAAPCYSLSSQLCVQNAWGRRSPSTQTRMVMEK